MRGLQDGSRIYCPDSVLKTRAGWDSGSWRISDTAFDLCLQIDDGIANRLRQQWILPSAGLSSGSGGGHRPRDEPVSQL